LNKTALFDIHLKSNARMVEYSGWEMPLNYGSQIEEHNFVRQAAGLFDVSHMMITDLQGKDVQSYLRKLLANDVIKLDEPNTALYTCMLNKKGGVIDDLIVYFLADNFYRIISNAGTRQKVATWLKDSVNQFEVKITTKEDLSIIAIQGPQARGILSNVLDQATDQITKLGRFQAFQLDELFIACTGYTGEDGFEILLANDQSISFWESLVEAGAKPIGLGARDSLRLEAGLNLYGADMDEETTPLETGLAWTVAWEPENREFNGRTALETQKQASPAFKQIGLILQGKSVFRAHQPIFRDTQQVGEITSGGFSPVLGKSIALARVDANIEGNIEVQIRDKRHPVDIVIPPFI